MAHGLDYAHQLLALARDDAYVVRTGVDNTATPNGIVGFHAQQAIEKAIKAVLSHRNAPFPKSHDLLELMELVKDLGLSLPGSASDADMLTPYGVEVRYGMVRSVPFLDRAWAAKCVHEFLAWSEGILGKP